MVVPALLPVLGWGSLVSGLATGGALATNAALKYPRSRKKSYLDDQSLFRDGSYEGDIDFLDQVIGITPEGLKTAKIDAITYDTKNNPKVLERLGVPGFRQPRPGETADAYLGNTANQWKKHTDSINPLLELERQGVQLQRNTVANQASAIENQASAQRDLNDIERIRLADDKISRQEDRLHALQILQAQQEQSNNQWAREVAYYDRKDEARREEKELEALLVGLTMLGANLFV